MRLVSVRVFVYSQFGRNRELTGYVKLPYVLPRVRIPPSPRFAPGKTREGNPQAGTLSDTSGSVIPPSPGLSSAATDSADSISRNLAPAGGRISPKER